MTKWAPKFLIRSREKNNILGWFCMLSCIIFYIYSSMLIAVKSSTKSYLIINLNTFFKTRLNYKN